MARTSFADMACSLARTLDLVGEWWTPLILRDVHLGLHRFGELQSNLEMSRKVLAVRLDSLVEDGLLERRPYSAHPPRDEYLLTPKGRELIAPLMALMAWGDRWLAGEDGPPMRLRHDRCGEITAAVVSCAACGEPLDPGEVTVLPGPGGRASRGTREIARRWEQEHPLPVSPMAGETQASRQGESD